MKIAILCKNPKKLSGSVAFLRKRDIQATTFDSLPEFLQGMKEETFDIMLISLNFNHQKPEKIPALMQQMFKLHAIVFCETKDAATQHALNSFRFKIPDQATGPAIAMTISRAFRELEMEANGKHNGISRQRLPGQTGDDNQHIISMTGGNADGDGSIYLDSARSTRDDKTINSKTHAKSGIYIDHTDFTPEELAAEEAEMARLEVEADEELARKNEKAKLARAERERAAKETSTESSTDTPSEGKSQQGAGTKTGRQSSTTGRRAGTRGQSKRQGEVRDHDDQPWREDLNAETAALLEQLDESGQGSEGSSRELSMDAIALWVCALGAVKSIAGESSRVLRKVKSPGYCFLLSLRTLKAQGTFVIMISSTDELLTGGEEMAHQLVDELFRQMQENEFGFPKPSEFDLVEVDPFLIQEEVIARARFSSSRENDQLQLSMSFVTHTEMLTYADFDDDALVEIPLTSIEPELPLEFAVHIKMKVSRSYLCYVNEQGSLGRNQAVRLTGYGIRSLYIQKEKHDKYLLHVARQEVNAELKKRGLRLVKKSG